MCCKSGNNLANTEINLVDETYNKGAHFVLGLTESVMTASVNDWLNCFLISLRNSINDLQQILDDAITNSGNATIKDENGNPKVVTNFPAYFIGDTSQYLK